MSLRILIVDDEAPARRRLRTLLSDLAAQCPHEIAGEADGAQTALDAIGQLKPDVVLLDVQMPSMNGIELARHIAKTMDIPPVIVFVTAYDDYALRAFEVHALDYLLKPVRASRLAEAIHRASSLRMAVANRPSGIERAAATVRATRQHFSVQERGRLLLVPVDDVVYLKAELKYVTLRTPTREYLIEESLTSVEEELASVFVRVHRNALVARSAIVGVERGVLAIEGEAEYEKPQDSWQVILRDIDERLPISRRQWPVVKALVR